MKIPALLVFLIPLIATQETNDVEEATTLNVSYNSLPKTDVPKNNAYECELPWRLPRNILPTHYDITLRIDPDNPQFNGTVNIDIECFKSTRNITLHSKELIINTELITVKRKSEGGPAVIFSNITLDPEHETINFELKSPLEAGKYVLSIPSFVGKIQEEDIGLFLRTYEVKMRDNSTYSTRKIIASQLESTYARMVFPCFDEPNMKATFTAHIQRPSIYTSFSDMPLTNSTPISPNTVLDTFEESPLLPTYAMAFLVAEYSRYPGSELDRTNILVPEQDLDKVDFAYRLAKDALSELESYTKIPYPVRKVDHVSIPDFPSEAMENWGLLLYQNYSLVDDWKTRTVRRQESQTLIAHELAHQWFGNMATAEWWSYLWINEGFATFFQFYISAKTLPHWQLWDQFFVLHFQEAMIGDANTEDLKPAMTSRRCTPKEIQMAFNEISYDKGACILKMLKFVMGEEEFQGALRLYLQRRMKKNARPADLFEVLDEINVKLNDSPLPKNVTFQKLGEDWTEQAGFPVITVTRDYTSSSIFVKQERFFDQRSQNLSVENQDNRWWIPLTWTSASSLNTPRRPQDWLNGDKNLRVYIPRDDWLLFNINVEGFYRVNYDQQNWNLLIRGLQRFLEDFSVPNRIQLVDDVFSLGFAHRLNLGTALSLSRVLKDEVNVIVWISANRQFKNLYDLVASTPAYPKLEKYLQGLMREMYHRVRLDVNKDDPHMDRVLRESLADVACVFGLDLCLLDAQFALSQFLVDVSRGNENSARENLHPDTKWTVLCGGIQSGGEPLFQAVRSLSVDPSIENDNRDIYLAALSCTKDFTLLTRHLEDIFNNNTLLSQEQAAIAVQAVLENQRSLYTGYQFVRNNVNKINHFYNCSTKYTEALVKEISDNIRTTTFYDEVRQWIISSNGDELGNKTLLLNYLESRKAKVEWSNESAQQVSDWLDTPETTLPQPIATSNGKRFSIAPLATFVVLIAYLQTNIIIYA